jgi:hypothetical protein
VKKKPSWLKSWSDGMITILSQGYSKGIVTIIIVLLLTVPPAWVGPVSAEDGKGGGSSFSFEGYLEMENVFNTRTDQSFEDAAVKNELRAKLKMRYGTDNAHLFLSPDIYLSSGRKTSAYADDFDVSENLRTSGRGYELAFNGCYVHYGSSRARVRAGNQIYGWGTADTFNPTSYFNPYDMREVLFRDDDEQKLGVPSVSGMVFSDSATAELVLVPVHVPGVLAGKGRYWETKLTNFKLPIVIGEPEALSGSLENTGFGARVSKTVLGTDISVSAYHGPDKDFTFVHVKTLIDAGEPVSVLVTPMTYPVTYFGFDFSRSLDTFVFQAEAAFSPDKRACMEQDMDGGTVVFPYGVERSRYIACALGFNYFIPLYELIEGHEGDTVLTVEWYQARYLQSGRVDPLIGNLLSARFQDSYLKSRVPVAITVLATFDNPGYAVWPKIGYDFQNGFSTTVSFIHSGGRCDSVNATESLFYYFRDNDSLIWEMHYDF